MKVSIHGICEERLIAFTNRNKDIPQKEFEKRVRDYVGVKFEGTRVNFASDCDADGTMYVIFDFDAATQKEIEI